MNKELFFKVWSKKTILKVIIKHVKLYNLFEDKDVINLFGLLNFKQRDYIINLRFTEEFKSQLKKGDIPYQVESTEFSKIYNIDYITSTILPPDLNKLIINNWGSSSTTTLNTSNIITTINNIKHLTCIGNLYNQSIVPLLPVTITDLIFNDSFNDDLNLSQFNYLTSITLGSKYNKPISNNQLPLNLNFIYINQQKQNSLIPININNKNISIIYFQS